MSKLKNPRNQRNPRLPTIPSSSSCFGANLYRRLSALIGGYCLFLCDLRGLCGYSGFGMGLYSTPKVAFGSGLRKAEFLRSSERPGAAIITVIAACRP